MSPISRHFFVPQIPWTSFGLRCPQLTVRAPVLFDAKWAIDLAKNKKETVGYVYLGGAIGTYEIINQVINQLIL